MSRSSKYSLEELQRASRMVDGGMSVSSAAREVGVSRDALNRHRKKERSARIKGGPGPMPGEVIQGPKPKPSLELHKGGGAAAPPMEEVQDVGKLIDRMLVQALLQASRAKTDRDRHMARLEFLFWASTKAVSMVSAMNAQKELARLQQVDQPLPPEANPFGQLSFDDIEAVLEDRWEDLDEDKYEALRKQAVQLRMQGGKG